MPKIILFIACSLDGYIARPDGDIEWLSKVERKDEDYGYSKFIESIDAIAMGSNTYRQVLGFGEWPYEGKTTFVFSKSRLHTDRPDILFMPDSLESSILNMEARGFDNIWLMGGGELISSFYRSGLIDEYMISIVPFILGKGIRLFGDTEKEADLKLVSSKKYDSGLVQVHYKKPDR